MRGGKSYTCMCIISTTRLNAIQLFIMICCRTFAHVCKSSPFFLVCFSFECRSLSVMSLITFHQTMELDRMLILTRTVTSHSLKHHISICVHMATSDSTGNSERTNGVLRNVM